MRRLHDGSLNATHLQCEEIHFHLWGKMWEILHFKGVDVGFFLMIGIAMIETNSADRLSESTVMDEAKKKIELPKCHMAGVLNVWRMNTFCLLSLHSPSVF